MSQYNFNWSITRLRYCDYITRLDQFEFTESAMVLNTSNLDQQLAQSRTTLKRAQEQFDLSKATYKRYQDLFNRKVIYFRE